MGFVWHARDQVLDREVAVKEVFVPDRNEDRSERAFREARAAGRLNHSGIVTIHDLVSDEGRSWIVMELVRAPSLEAALRESGPMAPGRVARIGLALLEALRAAYEAGILHRDIKPGNVLLPGNRAVITDFGIATIEGLLRDDPGARLTAGQASALLESLSAGLPAGTGPGQTRLDVPAEPRGASAGWWHRRSSRLVAAAAGLAAVVTAVLLAVTLSSGAPASHGQARATFSPATTPTTVGCASARWRTTRRRPRQNSSSASAALPVTCTAWPGTSPSPAYFVQMTALSASWQSWQSVFSVFFATFRPS
jgi:serine/threonine protein kinase